jgi:serine/threonine-protein kinase
MSVKKILNIILDICEGLGHAHENNIYHRDIKPDNILITKEGVSKITDFGISKIPSEVTVNQKDHFVCSIHYVSPEQIKGEDVDKRSDIYSLGVTFYELLTGKVPYEGNDPYFIMQGHVKKAPDFKGGKDVPKEVLNIVKKMLEKSPQKRYQSVFEVINDINKVLREKKYININNEVKKSSKEKKKSKDSERNNDNNYIRSIIEQRKIKRKQKELINRSKDKGVYDKNDIYRSKDISDGIEDENMNVATKSISYYDFVVEENTKTKSNDEKAHKSNDSNIKNVVIILAIIVISIIAAIILLKSV